MVNKRPKSGARLAVSSFPIDRCIVYLLAFVVFALPMFIWPGITEYGYGKSIAALIAISALTILWGLDGWRKGTWVIRLPWMTLPVLGIVLAGLLSLVAATNARVVIQSLVLIVFFHQFLLLLVNHVREQRDVNLLLFAVLSSAFLVALYGLLQYLGIMRGAAGGSGIGEIISTMGNRNYLGGFLLYLLFPAAILLVRLRSGTLRIAAILLIAFCFGTVLLVQQTATVVSLVVAGLALLAGLAIFRPVAPIRRNRIWLLVFLAVIAITYLVQAPSGPLNSIVGLSADERSWIGELWARNSGNVRSWDWWVGWEMFKDHPITGIGLGNYKINFIPYKAIFLATPRGADYSFYIARAAQAHNEYVQVAAELGIVGLLALAGLLIVLPLTLWKRIRRNKDEADRFDLLLLSVGAVAFLVHCLVSFPAHLPASMVAVLLAVGLAHSTAYGTTGLFEVRLRRGGLKATLVAVSLIGLAVSIVAGRDLAANILMGEGIRQLQFGQSHLAEATLRKSIALDFAPRQTYFHLAGAQLSLGAQEAALANLERCLTRFTDESVYLLHADVSLSLGQIEAARDSIALLLATHPQRETEIKARYIQANIAARGGDLAEATHLLLRLADDAPDNRLAYIALGSIYQAQGLAVSARKHFETALVLIEGELARAEGSLSGRTSMPYDEYASLQQTVARLQEERDTVLSKLAALPPS